MIYGIVSQTGTSTRIVTHTRPVTCDFMMHTAQ